MSKPEEILYQRLMGLLEKYGEGQVPTEELEDLWNTFPKHIWEGLRDKQILTKEDGMVYIME